MQNDYFIAMARTPNNVFPRLLLVCLVLAATWVFSAFSTGSAGAVEQFLAVETPSLVATNLAGAEQSIGKLSNGRGFKAPSIALEQIDEVACSESEPEALAHKASKAQNPNVLQALQSAAMIESPLRGSCHAYSGRGPPYSA